MSPSHQVQGGNDGGKALRLEAPRPDPVKLLDGELHALVHLALVRNRPESVKHAATAQVRTPEKRSLWQTHFAV